MIAWLKPLCVFLLFAIITPPCFAHPTPHRPVKQNQAVAFYVTQMTTGSIQKVIEGRWHFTDSTLYSLEYNHELSPERLIRRIFKYLWATVEVNMNVTHEQERGGAIVELNPFINLRWRWFPWNRWVATTFAFGEGVSYASRRPWVEQRTPETSRNGQRFLNYLVFELTLAPPSHPEWQVLFRIHHRSGAFGVYCPGRVGSNAIGAGLRFNF